MIVKAIYCKNFMRFSEFSLPSLPTKGIIGIFGENESGKSTIGEMLCFSLFGKTTEELIKWKTNECKVKVEFSIENHDYSVERAITRNNEEATLYDITNNYPIATGPKEVTDKICSLIGYGFKEFRYSIYIAQGELELIFSDSEERKIVLNNMLGIGKFEKTSNKVRNKCLEIKRNISSENDKLENKIKMLDDIQLKKKEAEMLTEKIDILEKQLYSKKKRAQEIKTILNKLEEGIAKREKLPALNQKVQIERDKLKLIEEQIEQLKQSISKINQIESEIATLENEKIEINQTKIPEIIRKLETFKGYELLKKKLEQREKNLEAKNERFNEIHSQLIKVKEMEQKIDKLESNLQMLNSVINTLVSKPNTINLLKESYLNITNLYNDILLLFLKEIQLVSHNEENLLNQLKKIDEKIKNNPKIELNEEKFYEIKKKISLYTKRKYAVLFSFIFIIILSVASTLTLSPSFLYLLLITPLLALLYNKFDRKIDNEKLEEYKFQEEENILNLTNINLEELRKEKENLISQIEKLRSESTEIKRKENLLKNASFKTIEDMENLLNLINSENFKFPTNFQNYLTNFIKEYKLLLSSIPNVNLQKIISQSEEALINDLTLKRDYINNELKELKRNIYIKDDLLREINFLLKEIESLQLITLNYRKELELYNTSENEALKLQEQKSDLIKRIKEIDEEIENKRHNIEYIQNEYERFGILEEKKKALIDSIDKNLQELYEIKSSLKEIELYESKLDDLKEEARQIETEIIDLSQMLAGAMGERKQLDFIIATIPQLKSEIIEIKQKITQLQKDFIIYEELEKRLIATSKDIKRRIIPQIEAYFSWILPKIIKDRYLKVRISDDFSIKVFSPERGSYIPLSNLSRGTIEQLLITLRLAFSKAVTTKSNMQFLFLDEPFTSFDTTRRDLFFELLKYLLEDFEQIFVISHLPKLEEKMSAFIVTSLEDEPQPVKVSWQI